MQDHDTLPATAESGMGRVLVTGATGFIGYAVAEALARRGARPRLMVRRPERGRLLTGLDVEPVHGDLESPESLDRAVKGVDTVIHLAARATFERYERVRPTIVDGSRRLMEAAVKAEVGRFVYASSALVYGDVRGTIDASTPTAPRIGYGRAKVEAEEVLRRTAPAGMKLGIVRLPHVYGARSYLFDRLRHGPLIRPGSGENRYSHLHIDDAVRVLLAVADRGWQGTSPVADDDPVRWNVFFSVLARYFPRMRLVRMPAWLAVSGAGLLEGLSAWRGRPTLHTADTVRGWLQELAIEPGLLWKDLGISPHHASIESGIPAALDDAVAYRWLHPTRDPAR